MTSRSKKTIPNSDKLTKKEIKNSIPTDHAKPKYRSDCKKIIRPCPYVSCKYNLYLDVKENGSLLLNFPKLKVHEMKESCALDVAERNGIRLFDVRYFLNITGERIRQIEIEALFKIRKLMEKVKKEHNNES